MTHPLEGQIVLLAGAKASVTLTRLSELLMEADEVLEDRREQYDREYERLCDDGERVYYAVESGHWRAFGAEQSLDEREADALERAHEEQLLRAGRYAGRREEFVTTLEIRECVVLAAR
jgi:NDP-sugar pyrophosphorylase family protein